MSHGRRIQRIHHIFIFSEKLTRFFFHLFSLIPYVFQTFFYFIAMYSDIASSEFLLINYYTGIYVLKSFIFAL